MTTIMVIALTLWMEARSEGMSGMYNVACVIHNRAERSGESLQEVVLKPKQFSCWNDRKPEDFQEDLPVGAEWIQAKALAKQLVLGRLQVAHGATHYYNPALASPSWAKHMTVVKEHKHHIFLKEGE